MRKGSIARPELLSLLILPFFFGSCVSIFKASTQKDVELTTEEEDTGTKVRVLSKKDSGKGSLTVGLERQHQAHQAVLSKDGYKDAYRVVYSDKFGAGTVVCLVLDAPFFLLYYPAMLEFSESTRKKFWDYRDPYYLEPPRMEIPKRDSAQKFLVHRSTSLNTEMEDTSYVEYDDPEAYREGEEPADVGYRSDSLNFETYLGSSEINELLVSIGYQDSSGDGGIVLNDYNSVGLESVIEDFKIRMYGKRGNYFNTVLKVNWRFTNNFGEKLYDTTITSSSGDFSHSLESYGFFTEGVGVDVEVENREEAHSKKMEMATLDALERSLIKLVRSPEVDELLEKGTKASEEDRLAELEPLRIERPPSPSRDNMNQQIQGVVTIQRKDGHGSGSIISSDGYVLTNYHVVAGADSVDVLFGSGATRSGVVERKSKVMDLAIVKLDTNGLQPLRIQQGENISIGSDVMAIGTPQNVQLGQTVTKGIISGTRTFNELDYIQTDVSINSGNSGGALIDRSTGEMIGVVTAKMFGMGVEGIGFAVPAEQALEKLKIEYE